MSRIRAALLASIALCLGCEEDACSASAIGARLDAARAGDVVEIGACHVRGALIVPAGVVLAGAGRGVTIVERDGGGQAIDLVPGPSAEAPTTVRDLEVVASSGHGIRAVDGGYASIVRVGVEVSAGIAIAARDLEGLTIESVSIEGGLDAGAAAALPYRAGPEDGGSYGLVLIRVGAASAPAQVIDLAMGEVGPWGGLVDGGALRAERLEIGSSVGIGLQAIDADVELVDTSVTGVAQGRQTLPAIGVVISGSGGLDTERLTVRDVGGLGVLQVGAAGAHRDLLVEACTRGGVWMQSAPSLAILGASRVVGAGVAGIAAIEVGSVVIEGARVEGTVRGLTIPDGTMGAVEAGDGIVLRGTIGSASLTDLMLSSNARVGLLIDGPGDALDRIDVAGVSVSSEGAGLGAIAQAAGAVVPGGTWDGGIVRSGAAVANDAALATPLAVPGPVPLGAIPAPFIE
jgi:hypothetical protein